MGCPHARAKDYGRQRETAASWPPELSLGVSLLSCSVWSACQITAPRRPELDLSDEIKQAPKRPQRSLEPDLRAGLRLSLMALFCACGQFAVLVSWANKLANVRVSLCAACTLFVWPSGREEEKRKKREEEKRRKLEREKIGNYLHLVRLTLGNCAISPSNWLALCLLRKRKTWRKAHTFGFQTLETVCKINTVSPLCCIARSKANRDWPLSTRSSPFLCPFSWLLRRKLPLLSASRCTFHPRAFVCLIWAHSSLFCGSFSPHFPAKIQPKGSSQLAGRFHWALLCFRRATASRLRPEVEQNLAKLGKLERN